MFMGNTFLLIGYRSFFKADRNKHFVSNEKQIDNHTLMLDMLHSNMSAMCTYHCRGVFKNIFWCCSSLIFVAKKPAKGTEHQFLCTQGTLQSGRVEDHRMMCTRHLHLITTIIYSSNTLHIYNIQTRVKWPFINLRFWKFVVSKNCDIRYLVKILSKNK